MSARDSQAKRARIAHRIRDHVADARAACRDVVAQRPNKAGCTERARGPAPGHAGLDTPRALCRQEEATIGAVSAMATGKRVLRGVERRSRRRKMRGEHGQQLLTLKRGIERRVHGTVHRCSEGHQVIALSKKTAVRQLFLPAPRQQ
jgi:hypothetical protein